MPVPLPPNAKSVFQSERHAIWEWEQKLFDGSTKTYSCVIRNDTAAVIPFLDSETILLIQEEQPGRPGTFFDVPGGVIDAGERALDAAARELHEETGYRGEVGLFREIPFFGMTRFIEYVCLAKNLKDGDGVHLDAGEKIELKPTPWKEAVAMCLRGELRRQEAMLAILAMEFDPEARKIKERFLNGS